MDAALEEEMCLLWDASANSVRHFHKLLLWLETVSAVVGFL